MGNCVFCKIANKEIAKEFAFESESMMAFDDLHPKAPIHILVAPKAHITSVKDLRDGKLAGEIVMTAKKLAEDKKLEGYKLIFNVGRAGGQEIDHLHLHLLGGF